MIAQAPTRKGSKTLRTPSYLEGMDIDLFVPVYAACAARGVPALDVDEMEVWQVASTLEIDLDPEEASQGTTTVGPPPPGALSRGRKARSS